MKSEKYKALFTTLIDELPESHRTMFQELAEHALYVGYLPKQCKTQSPALDFSNSKTRKTILKLELNANAKKGNPPGIRLKFYATAIQTGIFGQGIKSVIEEYNGRYTGCYGCGKCPGKPEGYIYVYPDGHQVFRCGGELIPLEGYSEADIPEIKRLMELQAKYFEGC